MHVGQGLGLGTMFARKGTNAKSCQQRQRSNLGKMKSNETKRLVTGNLRCWNSNAKIAPNCLGAKFVLSA